MDEDQRLNDDIKDEAFLVLLQVFSVYKAVLSMTRQFKTFRKKYMRRKSPHSRENKLTLQICWFTH